MDFYRDVYSFVLKKLYKLFSGKLEPKIFRSTFFHLRKASRCLWFWLSNLPDFTFSLFLPRVQRPHITAFLYPSILHFVSFHTISLIYDQIFLQTLHNWHYSYHFLFALNPPSVFPNVLGSSLLYILSQFFLSFSSFPPTLIFNNDFLAQVIQIQFLLVRFLCRLLIVLQQCEA